MTNQEAANLLVKEYGKYKALCMEYHQYTYSDIRLSEAVAMAVAFLSKEESGGGD